MFKKPHSEERCPSGVCWKPSSQWLSGGELAHWSANSQKKFCGKCVGAIGDSLKPKCSSMSCFSSHLTISETLFQVPVRNRLSAISSLVLSGKCLPILSIHYITVAVWVSCQKSTVFKWYNYKNLHRVLKLVSLLGGHIWALSSGPCISWLGEPEAWG